jgi:hypothetical protein
MIALLLWMDVVRALHCREVGAVAGLGLRGIEAVGMAARLPPCHGRSLGPATYDLRFG